MGWQYVCTNTVKGSCFPAMNTISIASFLGLPCFYFLFAFAIIHGSGRFSAPMYYCERKLKVKTGEAQEQGYHQCWCNLRLIATIIDIDFCFFSSLLSTVIEIGFTQQRIFHTEEFRQFETLINKSRASEQSFTAQVELSTLNSPFGRSATRGEDFQIIGSAIVLLRLGPSQPNRVFSYLIIGDNTPENQEVFQLSITPAIGSPTFTCNEANGCFQQLEIVIQNDDGELGRFLLIFYFTICLAE